MAAHGGLYILRIARDVKQSIGHLLAVTFEKVFGLPKVEGRIEATRLFLTELYLASKGHTLHFTDLTLQCLDSHKLGEFRHL